MSVLAPRAWNDEGWDTYECAVAVNNTAAGKRGNLQEELADMNLVCTGAVSSDATSHAAFVREPQGR